MAKRRRPKATKANRDSGNTWVIAIPVLLVVGAIAYIAISELIRPRASAPQSQPVAVPVAAKAAPTEASPASPTLQQTWTWHKDQEGLFEFEMQGPAETVNQERQTTVSRHIGSPGKATPVSYTVSLIRMRTAPQMNDDQRWTRIREFLVDIVNTTSSQEITQDGRRCLDSIGTYKRSGERVRRRDFSLDGQWVSMQAMTTDTNLDLKSSDIDRFFNSIKFPTKD